MKPQYTQSGPVSMHYSLQPETVEAMEHLKKTCPGTVSTRDMQMGYESAEPLLVMMDAAVRWVKAYRARFESPAGDDYMAKPEIGSILSGIRGLINFDGAAAMEHDVAGGLDTPRRGYSDSKDNGVIESLYWKACEIAGIDGESL